MLSEWTAARRARRIVRLGSRSAEAFALVAQLPDQEFRKSSVAGRLRSAKNQST
jgi:hypothetical protein